MLRNVASSLIKTRRLLRLESRATYIRGYWPEPVTQQTLNDFLHDINYFEEPKKLINIGLEQPKQHKKDGSKKGKTSIDQMVDAVQAKPDKVDEILGLLAQDTEPPALDYDDVQLEGQELIGLALSAGVFRDLFNVVKYVPNREEIKFTREQAERMDKFVPYYWITDQPFARVDRHTKEPEPIRYFDPIVGISARFVHAPQSGAEKHDNDELYAHTSYYGNIIPACEALSKPSIALDGKLLLAEREVAKVNPSHFNNWIPGQVELVNFGKNNDKYYSVALVNLDYLHEDASNLHWMVANIRGPTETKGATTFDEICDYLPVHGIQGFGYSRYVFLVFQHDSKMDASASQVNSFSLESRKFDVNTFISNHKAINMVPIGLSWFQTSWDESSNRIFHDYCNVKAPVYEHIQAKLEPRPEVAYPGKVPFNIFLDHVRNKKEINEQVLLERLQSVDPLDYKDQYVPPKVPPTVFDNGPIPSWMTNVMFKKKNKVGYWRGLRPASSILPLNNNADLDYPLRPVASSKKVPPGFPNQYPAKPRYKMHKDMPTSKPPNEHEAVFVQDDHEVHLSEVKKIIAEFEVKKK